MPALPPPLPPKQLQGRPAECATCFYPLDDLPEFGKCPDCGTPYGTPAAGTMSVRLQKCPQCDYSLQGIAESGRCPECGFLYDDQTFVLEGIARGMSTMPAGRKVLWIFVGGVGAFGPMVVTNPLLKPADGGMIIAAGLGLLWVAAIVYLLMTGKKEKRGTEQFLFAAGGFGSCSELDPTSEGKIALTRWSDVDTVTLDRVSPTWRRLRIGLGGSQPGKYYKVMLDTGVFCNEAQAPVVVDLIQKRIASGQR